MDRFDPKDDAPASPVAQASRMRFYIAAGLLGFGALGVLGGMLHILPA